VLGKVVLHCNHRDAAITIELPCLINSGVGVPPLPSIHAATAQLIDCTKLARELKLKVGSPAWIRTTSSTIAEVVKSLKSGALVQKVYKSF